MRWVRALLVAFCALVFGPAPGAYADCSSPAAVAGVVLYNSTHSVPQYCDGTDWIRMAPPSLGLPSNGLATHWKFDEGSGTTADDSIGSNDGTHVSTPAWDNNGVIGNALQFNGTDEAVKIVDNATLKPSSISVSVWFKLESGFNTTYYNTIVGKAEGGGYFLEVDTQGDDCGVVNALCWGVWVSGAYRKAGTSTAISTDTWHHAVGTYDQSEARLYLDGLLVDFTSFAGSISHINYPLCIGSDVSGAFECTTDFFKGSIDDVRIYNRALTAEEIARCCSGMPAADKGDFTTGLAGHWKLDETTGTTADDAVSTNDGAMQGGLDAANNAVTGVRNTALEFDGVNDQVSMGDVLDLIGSPVTIAAWVKPVSLAPYEPIVNKFYSGAGDHGNYRLVLADSSGNVQFLIRNAAGTNQWIDTTSNPLQVGQWTHVAVTYDNATTARIYIDGQFNIQKTNFSITRGNTSRPLELGKNTNNDAYLDGALDDVRIYDRVLTAEDVKALYMDSAKYCENPGGVPGQIQYDLETHAPMYCDGGQWVAMAPDVLGNGLVGHWKLDEASGTLADSSGNGNTGTQSGGVGYSSAGMIGTSLKFDGVNDAISVNDASQTGLDFGTSTDFTISAWVRPESGVLHRIVTKRKNDTPGYALLETASGFLMARVNDAVDNSCTKTLNIAAGDGKWHHVVAVFKRNASCTDSDILLYQDNVAGGTISGSAINMNTDLSNGLDFTIGSGNFGVNPWHGNLDDVRIYNRALSAAEVAALYDYGLQDDGLIAHWPLNEDGGTVARDMAGDNIGYASGGVVFGSAGQVGLAAGFDGVDDIINIGGGTSLEMLLPLTFSLWMYPRQDKDAILVSTDRSTSTSYSGAWLLLWPPRGISAMFGDSGGCTNSDYREGSTPNNAYTLNAWNHVVGIIRGPTDMSIYVNGVDAGPISYFGTGGAMTYDAAKSPSIGNGGAPCNPGLGFDGLIDDARIYNRALTANEIAEIQAAGAAGLAAQDCTNPNGAEGAIIYNLNENAPQYCDGARWVRLGGP